VDSLYLEVWLQSTRLNRKASLKVPGYIRYLELKGFLSSSLESFTNPSVCLKCQDSLKAESFPEFQLEDF